ncbi:hypothetical protein [Streptomyces sp. NBC_00989]|uniref:hypothetical protein n=1 Tax=Streptomyces sp. NBC_00989 TaxID=2903705 RepID=UPI0038704D9B|nr:hypothetical protein OG714_36560 [Streptomyces sp. NBC_00989]
MTSAQQIFNRTGAELSAEAQRVVDGTRQQAAAFIDSANTTVQRAMDRKGLTDQARQAIAARTYRQAQAQSQKLLDEHIAGIERHKKTLIDRAFGARGGDAQTIANRRAAQQLVAGIDSPDAALQMLRTAQQDGDAQLAQVIAGHAYSYGWEDIVDEWNADGSNNTAVAGLIERNQLPDTTDFGWRMGVSSDFHIAKPSVLDGLREQEIDMLARDDLGGEAA